MKKKNKYAIIAFIIICLFGFLLAGYANIGLIFQDFETKQGMYLTYNRGKEVCIQKFFF